MILRCSYEELSALKHGVRAVMEGGGSGMCSVLAPPQARLRVEGLSSRLRGDLSIRTLADQRRVSAAIAVIVRCLRAQMESLVSTSHPADEGAVAAYFDFAHALSVLHRVREMGQEMEAVIELVTGRPATPRVAETFAFPD